MLDKVHAYVDGEMSEVDRRRFERALERDVELQQQVAQVRELKALLQETYGIAPARTSHAGERSRRKKLRTPRWAGWAAALFVGVLLGTGLGWQLDRLQPRSAAMQAVAEATHVILHVDQDDPAKLAALLDEAEAFAHSGVAVTMVANAEAIKLFSVGYSPAPQKIEALKARYPNVSIVVCKRGLRNLARRGLKLQPLPGARSDTYALDYIVQGVSRGWKYQKI